MRPAVYASVLRSRKPGVRRVKAKTPHQFSWQRFFLLLILGVCLFIPGLVVTIIGIENGDDIANMPGDRVLYKVIGPAGLALGVGLMLASGIYYCCWGFQRPVKRHAKHRKHKHDHLDELQSEKSPGQASSQGLSQHSVYSSARSKHSPSQRSNTSLDKKSERHHSNHSHHRSSSKSPHTPEGSVKGHNSNSRHRSTSSHLHHHDHSQHEHDKAHHTSSSSPTSPLHTKEPVQENQVTFVDTDAPLACGESGSVDVAIDMVADSDTEKIQ